MTREQQLQEALELLLPIACFGVDHLEISGSTENYKEAARRVNIAQSLLKITPESWTINPQL